MSCRKERTHEPSGLDGRVRRVRSMLPGFDVEGMLLFGEANIRYLTGFTGSDGTLFAGTERSVLLVDGRYTTQAKGEASGCDIIEFTDRAEGVAGLLSDLGLQRVGVESPAITLDSYLTLQGRIKNVLFKPLSGEIERIRMIKDTGEAALLREAAEMAARALTETLEHIGPGIAERDVAAILEMKMRQAGGERPSFETIVASGSNSALPHATPGPREIQDGDFVTIDYGTVCRGYHSDETCTFAVGGITEKQTTVYAVVKGAHDKAIDAVRAGVSCRDIDAIARGHIDDAGYGGYFSHGTGHGVGLAVHEPPRLSGRAEDVLEEGMVITVEPGIYIPGLWGVRIEDTVMVEKDGCEILTKMSKDLRML
ncbi:MAG: aminopeptidase P family protein [Deltaproteobacteria bacterium]|nr:aminopeptidase P family protein [Deltaproteobacteria bacterium]